MIVEQWILYAIAAGITLLISIVGMIGYVVYRRNSDDVAYDKQLQELISTEKEKKVRKLNVINRWNNYWAKLFKESGWAAYTEKSSAPGRDVFVFGSVAMILISILTKSPLLGPLAVGIVGSILVMLIKFKNQKEQERLNEQLPGFLAALKANIQANTTPERALLKVVDDMPNPLYEDLAPAKQQILANTPFVDVIQNLSTRTKSKDLKFLAACILQAVATGANLEGQIDTIQRVLEERQKVNDELNRAVSSATPSMYIASIAIPAVFFATYFMNEATRDYWFVHPTSWLALIGVVLLWVLGMFMSKKQIDKIREL